MPPSDRTLELGRRVATALLGLDALYRTESEDPDGLVVLALEGSAELRAGPFESYLAAREAFTEIRRLAALVPEPDRRRYYDELGRSALAFIQWRERGLPFQDQIADFLQVPPEPATDAELDLLRNELGRLLSATGYQGDLRRQCLAWEDRQRVPAAWVPEVLSALMDEAWDRTEALVGEIPATKTDRMRVAAVSGVAFNARCSYLDRLVEINTDPILTRPGLKHLATHEGYPGHYLQFKLRETGYRRGTSPADVLLSVVNTASSSVFEGIADLGLDLIEWIETDDDRIQLLQNRYRAGIGTGAAWRLFAQGWPEPAVADWLRDQALTGGDGWVANRMAFIRAPARAALIWSYWWGEPVVRSAWNQVPAGRRPAFLQYLHGRMHSNTTVGMFQ